MQQSIITQCDKDHILSNISRYYVIHHTPYIIYLYLFNLRKLQRKVADSKTHHEKNFKPNHHLNIAFQYLPDTNAPLKIG